MINSDGDLSRVREDRFQNLQLEIDRLGPLAAFNVIPLEQYHKYSHDQLLDNVSKAYRDLISDLNIRHLEGGEMQILGGELAPIKLETFQLAIINLERYVLLKDKKFNERLGEVDKYRENIRKIQSSLESLNRNNQTGAQAQHTVRGNRPR